MRLNSALALALFRGSSGGGINAGPSLAADALARGRTLDANPYVGTLRAWLNDPPYADKMGRYRAGGPNMALVDAAFGSVFTFARNSVARDWDAYGLSNEIAANNVRAGFDPVSRLPAGWLIEGASTNLAWPSNDLRNSVGAWSVARGTVTTAAAMGVDGTLSMCRFVEDTQTGAHGPFMGTAPFTPSTTYTWSVVAKAGTRTAIRMSFDGGPYVANPWAEFNLLAGSVIQTGAGAAASVVALGGGLYRCSMTATGNATVGNGRALAVALAGGVSAYAGDGVSDFYVGDAQLEANYTASSVIKTTTGTVTRAADALSISGGAFASLFNMQSRTNLALQSQTFTVAPWAAMTSNATVTANAGTAPDGTNTANLVVEGTGNGPGVVRQLLSYTAGSFYTLSIYAKPATGTRFLGILMAESTPAFGALTLAIFDLAAGTITQTGNSPSANIVSVGGGWMRCSVTAQCKQSATNTAPQISSLPSGTNMFPSAAADGASSLLLWGAQLEATPVAPGVNLLAAPEAYGGAGWTRTAATVTPFGGGAAPDGSQADKLAEDATNAGHYLSAGPAPTFTAALPYVFTVYAKAIERSAVQLILGTIGAANANVVGNFDLSGAGQASVSGGGAASIAAVSGSPGWYRCSMSVAAASQSIAGTTQIRTLAAYAASPGGSSYQGVAGSGVALWGAQLVQAAAAPDYVPLGRLTSAYIPTTSAAVTKTGAEQGWVIVDAMMPQLAGAATTAFIAVLSDGTVNSRLALHNQQGTANVALQVRNIPGGDLTPVTTPIVAGVPFRAGFRFSPAGAALCFNGGALQSVVAPSMPVGLNQLQLGNVASLGGPGNLRIRAVHAGAVPPSDAAFQAACALNADVSAILG